MYLRIAKVCLKAMTMVAATTATTTELVKVPFHGDTLEAVQKDAHPWASVRRLCENIKLDFGSQLKRLKRQRWATVVIMTTVADDGKTRQTAMIRADKIPMWLATIDLARIKDKAIRDKIAIYQDEAAEVLARHFLAKPNAATPEMAAVFQVLEKMTNVFSGVISAVAQMADRISHLESRPIAAPTTPGTTGFLDPLLGCTVEGYLATWHPDWLTTRGQRKRIANVASNRVRQSGGNVFLNDNQLFFTSWQVNVLDHAAREIRRRTEHEGKFDGLGIFRDCDVE